MDSLTRYRSLGIRSESLQILGFSLTVDCGKSPLEPHCPHRNSGNTAPVSQSRREGQKSVLSA